MSIFLVESKLPSFTADFAAHIPEHREVVDELFAEGKLMMYTVTADGGRLLCAIQADDKFEVVEVLARMPIFNYLRPVVHDLMIYNGADQFMPRISLN